MGQQANPQKSPSKKKPPRKKKGAVSKTRINRAKIDEFCLQRKFQKSDRAAAIAAGFSPQSVYGLITNPRVQERMKVIDEKFIDKLAEKAAERFVLDVETIDVTMLHILVNGPTHFMRGDSDRVKAGETLYKRLHLIEPTKIEAKATAGAVAQGNNMMEVYESQWLTEKKRQMAEQLEKKHGAALPAATPTE